MVNLAQNIFKDLSQEYMVEIDIKWNIWKRYRRQDEIWTPYCLTIDYQTLEDWTITIRDRDSMQQQRIKIEEIKKFV
jgi:glycyl-tRNA synthetase